MKINNKKEYKMKVLLSLITIVTAVSVSFASGERAAETSETGGANAQKMVVQEDSLVPVFSTAENKGDGGEQNGMVQSFLGKGLRDGEYEDELPGGVAEASPERRGSVDSNRILIRPKTMKVKRENQISQSEEREQDLGKREFSGVEEVSSGQNSKPLSRNSSLKIVGESVEAARDKKRLSEVDLARGEAPGHANGWGAEEDQK